MSHTDTADSKLSASAVLLVLVAFLPLAFSEEIVQWAHELMDPRGRRPWWLLRVADVVLLALFLLVVILRHVCGGGGRTSRVRGRPLTTGACGTGGSPWARWAPSGSTWPWRR
ncbi:MAG TPA: hypothetical protein VGD67_24775 [Pseudonocardiaceae bacterium]